MKPVKAASTCLAVASLFILALTGCNQQNKGTDTIKDIPQETPYSENIQLKSLNQAIEANPVAENYYRRGLFYMEEPNYRKALPDLLEAIKLDSSQSKYHLTAARLFSRLPAIDKALTHAHKAEALGNNTPELYVTLGELYFINRDYGRAIDHINKGLQAAPHYAEAYFYKGLIQAERGDTTAALSSLQTAVEQQADYIDAYNKLAAINLARKKYDLAKGYLDAGLRFAPKDAFLNYNQGMYYVYTNQADSARSFLQKAIFFEPTLHLAHYNLGIFAFEAGNIQEAKQHFENAANYNDRHSPSHYYLARCQESMGDLTNARENYRLVAMLEQEFKKEALAGYKRVNKELVTRGQLTDSAANANPLPEPASTSRK